MTPLSVKLCVSPQHSWGITFFIYVAAKLGVADLLTIPGGSERTATEYSARFRDVGGELINVVLTPAGPSVVEAVPV